MNWVGSGVRDRVGVGDGVADGGRGRLVLRGLLVGVGVGERVGEGVGVRVFLGRLDGVGVGERVGVGLGLRDFLGRLEGVGVVLIRGTVSPQGTISVFISVASSIASLSGI